eukprot:6303186-Alexandrium_andersonii.AAC.1
MAGRELLGQPGCARCLRAAGSSSATDRPPTRGEESAEGRNRASGSGAMRRPSAHTQFSTTQIAG